MRTDIKSKEHFEWFIPKQAQRIERFENNIKIGKTKEERIPAVKRQIFTISLHRLVAKYSFGENISNLNLEFLQIIEKFENGWKDKGETPTDDIHFDNYVLGLWMLSLGVLLQIQTNEFERIVKVLDNSNRRDYLFDYIIKSKIPSRSITDKMTYPKYYNFLKDLIDNKSVENLIKYLEKVWYKSMKLTYWYDNHKSKADSFFGYWSFESGALVKILGLDDTILKEQQYYPYDMVHWKE